MPGRRANLRPEERTKASHDRAVTRHESSGRCTPRASPCAVRARSRRAMGGRGSARERSARIRRRRVARGAAPLGGYPAASVTTIGPDLVRRIDAALDKAIAPLHEAAPAPHSSPSVVDTVIAPVVDGTSAATSQTVSATTEVVADAADAVARSSADTLNRVPLISHTPLPATLSQATAAVDDALDRLLAALTAPCASPIPTTDAAPPSTHPADESVAGASPIADRATAAFAREPVAPASRTGSRPRPGRLGSAVSRYAVARASLTGPRHGRARGRNGDTGRRPRPRASVRRDIRHPASGCGGLRLPLRAQRQTSRFPRLPTDVSPD